eukprot:2112892-Prymnesium_polylepis.1
MKTDASQNGRTEVLSLNQRGPRGRSSRPCDAPAASQYARSSAVSTPLPMTSWRKTRRTERW